MTTLQDDIKYLKGVGPKREKKLNKLGLEKIEDIFYFIPRRYVDRSQLKKISQLIKGETATVDGEVVDVETLDTRKGNLYVITLYDGTEYLQCKFFNQKFIPKIFSIGDEVIVSGKVKEFRYQKQIVHPEYEIISNKSDELLHTGRIVPIYPLTYGLYQKNVRKIINNALNLYLDKVPETLPPRIIDKYSFPDIKKVIQDLHYPENMDDQQVARDRMAYEELFYLEIMLALKKHHYKIAPKEGITFNKHCSSCRKLVDNLQFELTNAQKRCIREIFSDMRSGNMMNRLLQGDVGSGKTIVAIIGILLAVESGYQAAFMAPTEILAEQHYRKVRNYLKDMDVEIVFLVGKMRKKDRAEAYEKIADGRAQIVIGTHALIQEKLDFHKLGYIIVDEQHRFGVMQRATLREKGITPDVLVMSATPIPRTLALTVYGDLDISVIDEMPPGRRNIITRWTTASYHQRVYSLMKKEIKKGRQVYVIYPLIEESEKMDLRAATTMQKKLQKDYFPEFNVGLLHGRMSNKKKEQVMQDFLNKEYHILVSTTVIEVGLDVPNASVMVIENAERFGLTQLHQLRGRVGRGEYQSYCILVASTKLNDDAKRRLQILQDTNDGFKIAEEDLKFRGPGEFFGTRQHGLPELKIADLIEDNHLLLNARDDAFTIINEDPNLRNPENERIHRTVRKKYLKRFELTEIG